MSVSFRLTERGITGLGEPGGLVFEHALKFARATTAKAKTITPVDTGRLRSSVDFSIVHTGREVAFRVGTDVSYAAPVHDGSRRGLRARPFIACAAIAVNEQFQPPLVLDPGILRFKGDCASATRNWPARH